MACEPATKSFTHISTFIFGRVTPTVYTPILHRNIVHLRLQRGQSHLFPYIRTYEVGACIFNRTRSIDLGNLTILIVTGCLRIESDCQVFLPVLRELKLETFQIAIGTKFETPALDALHFANINYPGGDINMSLLSQTHRSLPNDGYLLSPNTSIVADSHLLIPALIILLAKSPKVTHATLWFDDWEDAQTVLSQLLGLTTETNPSPAENEILCPRLSELRLDFDWEFSETPVSKGLLDALSTRDRPGFMTPLSLVSEAQAPQSPT